MQNLHLDNTTHFKEALQIIDLTERHSNKNERLEEGPHDDARVGGLVDGPVDAVSHLHILLLVLYSRQRARQLTDHVLQLLVGICVATRRSVRLLGRLPNGHVEHDHLGRHGGHLIREAIRVDAGCVCCKREFAGRFALALIDYLVVGAHDAHINVQEATLGNLKR